MLDHLETEGQIVVSRGKFEEVGHTPDDLRMGIFTIRRGDALSRIVDANDLFHSGLLSHLHVVEADTTTQIDDGGR